MMVKKLGRASMFKRAHSSFTDLKSANALVSSTLNANEQKIDAWLAGDKKQLVLTNNFKRVTGYGAYRGKPGLLDGITGKVPRCIGKTITRV